MDVKGARALAHRLGPNTGVTALPVPADVPAGALPLYRWVDGGGGATARVTEPLPPARRPWLRRIRFRGR